MQTLKTDLTKLCTILVLSLIVSCKENDSNQNGQNFYATETPSNTITPEQQREIDARRAEEQRQAYIVAINNVLYYDSIASKTSGGNDDVQAKKMREIDISGCPAEFATAYVDHIHAWENSGKIEKAQADLKNTEDDKVAQGIIATLIESDATPFSDYLKAEAELKRLHAEASSEINRTWQIAERVAVSYGATLPR